jgi:hypothetical protein
MITTRLDPISRTGYSALNVGQPTGGTGPLSGFRSRLRAAGRALPPFAQNMLKRRLPKGVAALYAAGVFLSVLLLAYGLYHVVSGGGVNGWGARRSGIRAGPLWDTTHTGGQIVLADDLTDDEAEAARKTVVQMLSILYRRKLLPFKTQNYARTKGVFDRVPLERFMEAASQHLVGVEHEK